MNTQKQQISVAKVCGWTDFRTVPDELQPDIERLEGQNNSIFYSMGFFEVPDYISDLNAMHEAEKVLTEAQRKSYAANLYKVVFQVGQYKSETFVDIRFSFILSHATAAQRAEAFLRTLGLWEND